MHNYRASSNGTAMPESVPCSAHRYDDRVDGLDALTGAHRPPSFVVSFTHEDVNGRSGRRGRVDLEEADKLMRHVYEEVA